MEMIGRSLIRRGEIVFLIDTSAGALQLLPAQAHDVDGGPWPDSWTYRLTLGSPSQTETYDGVPAASVLHFRYAVDPERPYLGNGPLGVATLAGRLSAETVNALADEVSGPRGRLLGIPTDGNDSTVAGIKADIANARGRMALIENSDWDNPGSAALDLKSARFGADPPPSLLTQAQVASREIYAACGLNSALWDSNDSSSAREAWRLALFGVIAPLGKKVQAELQTKLDAAVSLQWTELRASDLSGRARAFQSLVSGGMEISQAAALSGLMQDG